MAKTPSRLQNGVTNVAANSPFSMLGFLAPMLWISYFNDFLTFVPDEWLATVVDTDGDTGNTLTIDATPGGVLNILNNDNALDSVNLQLGGDGAAQFQIPTGKQCYVAAKIGAVDPTAGFIAFGLAGAGDVDLEGGLPDDHVIVKVDDGDALIDVSVSKNGTATEEANVGTLAAYTEGTNNLTEIALYYNGKDAVEVFVDGASKAKMSTANWPDDVVLAFTMELHNSDAAADSLAVDWVFVAVER